jgi:DMSO/TMAO reductase YedYZ molybdopterin-dependent catalytic subunit
MEPPAIPPGHAGQRVSIAWGLLAGVLVTSPLIALFYLAHHIARLPLVPFDIFDWLTRKLPGSVLTFGIDSLVKLINALHFKNTSGAAKTGEQALAIIIMLLAGIAAGVVFFAVRARVRGWVPGIVLGLIAGIPAALISYSMVRQTATMAVIGFIWVLAAFLAWGLVLNWIYLRLSSAPPVAAATDITVVPINRRQFMIKVAGTAAVITVAGAVVGRLATEPKRRALASQRWSKNHSLPNADAPVKPAPGTRPELTPLEQHYRIDINTNPPAVRESSWKLKIGGLVDQPLELTLNDIRNNYPASDQFITLSCISNLVGGDLIGTTRWTGVSLQRFLPTLHLKPNATHLKISSADGFYEIVALSDIKADDRIMLAYAWDGVPLLPEHGFPLRIYIPDLYGMKQPKWIVAIEAVDHWEPGYWVVRGWDAKAQMRSTSVIDTVAKNAVVNGDGQTLVPIGGIAHAGARHISKVEISVDNGPWQEAKLRTPLSDLTWVLWRYDWPLQKGQHTFTVRCFDGSGAPQITEVRPPHPSGATGLYSVSETI